MKRMKFCALLCVACGLILGCQGQKKPADLPELYPVKVTIIQDGAPLEGATVSLYDTTGSSRFTVGAKTDAKGVASLKTDAKYDGAPAGNYKVLVSKAFIPEVSTEVPPEDPAARAEFDKKMQEANSQQADLVDLKFKRPNSTPETLEVTASGAEATIDVGAKVEVKFSESMKSSSDH